MGRTRSLRTGLRKQLWIAGSAGLSRTGLPVCRLVLCGDRHAPQECDRCPDIRLRHFPLVSIAVYPSGIYKNRADDGRQRARPPFRRPAGRGTNHADLAEFPVRSRCHGSVLHPERRPHPGSGDLRRSGRITPLRASLPRMWTTSFIREGRSTPGGFPNRLHGSCTASGKSGIRNCTFKTGRSTSKERQALAAGWS